MPTTLFTNAYEGIPDGVNPPPSPRLGFALAAPLTGIWTKGDTLFNVDTVDGEPVIGWKCTQSGIPGVWGQFGNFAPDVTGPPVIRDTFFQTTITAIWDLVGTPVYAPADLFASANGQGLLQTIQGTPSVGLAVTFFVRLKQTRATNVTVTVHNDTTLLGTITVLAGQLLGTGKYVLGAAPSRIFKFTCTNAAPEGIHIESFNGLLLAADGGIVQTLDPYLNNSSVWTTSSPSATVANNTITIPPSSFVAQNLVQNNIPILSGDLCRVIIYVRQAGDGTCIISAGTSSNQMPLGPGLNTLRMSMGQNRDFTMSVKGDATIPWVIDYFFAIKLQ